MARPEKTKLDLNSLVVFALIAEANSFAAAARQLHIPTSTVSRRVSELEESLGVRLLERSTRRLRLTKIGADVLQLARQTVEVSETISDIASDHLTRVSGRLRISAPPSISESLIAPLVTRFQNVHPDVRVQVFITDRVVNQISEGVDLAFRVNPQDDSNPATRRILSYRHRLVASPKYLKQKGIPRVPTDLHQHRLVAFSFWEPQNTWHFTQAGGPAKTSITFSPHLSMNEYSGLSNALVSGQGIGDLPPIVQPELLRKGLLVEVMPEWHFRLFHLSLAHLENRYLPQSARAFRKLAEQMAPTLFPELPQ